MTVLKLSDGSSFEMDAAVAQRFGLIREMFADIATETITLPHSSDITGPVMKKVIEYVEHHKDEPLPDEKQPDGDQPRNQPITEWDCLYTTPLKDDQPMLFAIMLAANFLNIQPLLNLCCKTTAGMMKGLSPEQIRQKFNIVNDFTPEEEQQILKEKQWCESEDL